MASSSHCRYPFIKIRIQNNLAQCKPRTKMGKMAVNGTGKLDLLTAKIFLKGQQPLDKIERKCVIKKYLFKNVMYIYTLTVPSPQLVNKILRGSCVKNFLEQRPIQKYWSCGKEEPHGFAISIHKIIGLNASPDLRL